MMRILTGEEIRLAILTLLKKYRAEKAILCGSYSRDEADGRSDIDIPIIGGKHFNPTNVFCIANELYYSLGKAVDVYDISEINEDTEFYITIFSEGIEIRTKKGDIRMQQSDTIEILDETHRRCQSVFPCKIQDAYLYGSYARGDFDSESDEIFY